jgi:hypothetical protein
VTPFPSFPQIKFGFGGRGIEIIYENGKNHPDLVNASPISAF